MLILTSPFTVPLLGVFFASSPSLLARLASDGAFPQGVDPLQMQVIH
jgi:hypothetical protein